ncbi:MAG: ribose 5-phosphate isomerase B [Clostridia bacterium]|nr:ribose 5-phosphate isomerase B [Clostridia bacterium]
MIAIACDHAGPALKEEIKALLTEMGYTYKDFGTDTAASVDYPVYGSRAAYAVASGECEKGIVICGTGIGISISANKVKGVRCALCSEPLSASLTRQHNDANVLAIGARVTGPELAKEIVRVFLTTEFEGGRHQRRVDLITALENGEVL